MTSSKNSLSSINQCFTLLQAKQHEEKKSCTMRLESLICYISYCKLLLLSLLNEKTYLDSIVHVIWKNKNPRDLAGIQDKLGAKKWPTSVGRWLP